MTEENQNTDKKLAGYLKVILAFLMSIAICCYVAFFHTLCPKYSDDVQYNIIHLES